MSRVITPLFTTMNKSVAINPFVRRQIQVTDNSAFGGFTGTEQVLLATLLDICGPKTLEKEIEVIRFYTDDPGFQKIDGRFICTHGVIDNEATGFVFVARRENEQPVRVRVVKRDHRPEAQTIDFVLYSHKALEGDTSSDADYELVSINCMPTKLAAGVEEPMTPETLWRNYLAKIPGCPAGVGGTYRSKWDDESVFRKELAESEDYWKDKARIVIYK